MRISFDMPDLIPGMIYAEEANVHEAYGYLYKEGMKIAAYLGEYDQEFTAQGFYNDLKQVLPKDDYHELVHNKWSAKNQDSMMVKKMKNIHLGLMHNSGHVVS